MPLNAEGKISFNDMASEFGVAAGTPITLVKFRAGDAYGVSTYSGTGIPGAGQPVSMSKYRGSFKLVAPSMSAIPTVSGSSASSSVTLDTSTYVTKTYSGPVTYSLTNPPAGVTIDSTTGIITVASGTNVNQAVTVVVTGFAGLFSRSVTLNVTGVSGFTMSMPSVNSNPFYIDANNNANISNTGSRMSFTIDVPSGIYSDANGPYVAIKDVSSGMYLRHAGFVLTLYPFSQNSIDFAWKFVPDSTSGYYRVYNPYGGGYYIGYNGTNVLIQSPFTYPVRVTGSAILNRLSTAAETSCRGAFSCQLVNTAYIGPVLKIRRGADNVVADVYASTDSNYTVDGGGSFASWLGASVAYVNTWYDQSGTNNHGTQETTTKQPIFDLASKKLTFGATVLLSLPNNTIPSGNDAYTFVARHGSIGSVGGEIISCGGFGTTGTANGLRRDTNVYRNYWWGNDYTYGTYAANQVISVKYDGTARVGYTGGTSNTNRISNTKNTTSANTAIGNAINGELFTVFVFGTALSDADRIMVESC